MLTKDGPLWLVILAVGTGAAIGALCRWGLSYWLNPKGGSIPLGTLCANLLGGYLIGLAVAWFSANPAMPPYVRLFCVTGALGGLTTFSTFSSEAVALLMAGACGAAALHVVLHTGGSFLMTLLGMWTYRAF